MWVCVCVCVCVHEHVSVHIFLRVFMLVSAPYIPIPVVMNVSFVQTSISTMEGVGVIELILKKSPGGIGPVSVDLRTHDGTATGMLQSESRLSHLTRTLIIDKLLPLFLPLPPSKG